MTTITTTTTPVQEQNITTVGEIKYLDANGKVYDRTVYDDVNEMVRDVLDELTFGVDISITLHSEEHLGEFDMLEDMLHGLEVVPTKTVVL